MLRSRTQSNIFKIAVFIWLNIICCNICIAVEQYEYVIITTDALKNASGEYTLQDLIDSKIAKGMTAKLFTIEKDIKPYYPGNRPDGKTDIQTSIRDFIKDCYQNHGTQYVLLAGDYTAIPPRYWMAYEGYTWLATDMYYSNLEGTWDWDNDGQYGECGYVGNYETGEIYGSGTEHTDLTPEVCLGRATVKNGLEVSNFVRKTLLHNETVINRINGIKILNVNESSYPGVTETDWGGKILPTETEDVISLTSDSSVDNENTENMVSDIYEGDCNLNEIWYTPQRWSPERVVKAINRGVDEIFYQGPQNTIRTWVVTGDLTLDPTARDVSYRLDSFFPYYEGICSPGYGMKLDKGRFLRLKNEQPFFLYSDVAFLGDFTWKNGRCFADKLVCGKYGAYAVMACINKPGGYINVKKVLDDNPGITLGMALKKARLECVSSIGASYPIWYVGQAAFDRRVGYFTLTLFGDPDSSI